jgi:EAL domain-containing protein (putative c-di-GMP-specific phosphodiesterase class I)
VIKETDINPEYLTLELTESIFIKSTIALDGKIEELHDLGIKFSMDDFGTGYASLTYLRNIAFDNLKIDKSFIDGILSAKKENRIVATIVSLVHNLDMKVIAEGVEQKSQYEYLRQISTDVYQGYLMSKPLTLEETIDFVEQFYKVARSKRVDVLASRKD